MTEPEANLSGTGPRGNPDIAKHAQAGGQRSGEARQRLTLARVEAELGPLATVADAMRRLERLNVWIAAGLLPGSRGGAAVRAVEVWLKGQADERERLTLAGIEAKIAELEREIGKGDTWRE